MCQRDHNNSIKPILPKGSLEVVYCFICRVMDEYEPPNSQMVTELSQRLKTWWMNIRRDREMEIHQLLGGITFLIFVTPNPHLTRAY